MTSYARLMVVGYVGRDPDLWQADNGDLRASFSVAATRRRKVGDETLEVTTWYKVVTWRQLATSVSKYVKRGMLVLVDGTPGIEAYLTKEGKPAAALVVNASAVQFLTPAAGGAQAGVGPSGGDPARARAAAGREAR